MNRRSMTILLSIAVSLCSVSAQGPEKASSQGQDQARAADLKAAPVEEGKMLSSSKIKSGPRSSLAPWTAVSRILSSQDSRRNKCRLWL